MRILDDTSENYLHKIIHSIHRDLPSFAGWHCLHVKPSVPGHKLDTLIQQLRTKSSTQDYDVVISASHELFIFTREQPNSVYDELNRNFGLCYHLRETYNLFYDGRKLKSLLMSRAQPCMCSVPKEKERFFGELESLRDVMNEGKKLRGARRPQHVLLVEDDHTTRRIVANTLKDNYAVISAHDAQEAVSNYLLFAPDIVFLDIGLPDHSGLDVLHQIIEWDSDAYVVMFSANSYLDNVVGALNAGASGFIAKPFHKASLHSYIDKSTAHHHKVLA